MTARHEVKLEPFPLPQKVFQDTSGIKMVDGQRAASFDLIELSYFTLDQLCTEFRANLFARAGMHDKSLNDVSACGMGVTEVVIPRRSPATGG